MENEDLNSVYYLQHQEYKRLTKFETLELLKKGDKESLEAVFKGNIALLKNIIEKNFFYYYSQDKSKYDDIFQEGCCYFWKAINNFDINLGYDLSTYVTFSIIGGIKRYIRDNKKMHYSRRILDLQNKIKTLTEEYKKNHNENITVEELVKELNVEESLVIEAINSINNVTNFNDIMNEDGEEISVLNFIGDDSEIEYTDTVLVIKSIYDKYNDIHKKIISDILFSKVSQSEVAEKYKYSQPQISRILIKFKKEVLEALNETEKKEKEVKGRKKMKENLNNKTEIKKEQDEFDLVDKQVLIDNLYILSDYQRGIFEYYYGLKGEPKTISEIAEIMKIDKSKVSGSIYVARKKMKEKLNTKEELLEEEFYEDETVIEENKNNNGIRNKEIKYQENKVQIKVNSLEDIIKYIKNNDKEEYPNFILNDKLVTINTSQGICKLSNADILFNKIYQKGIISKKCIIYRMSFYDKNLNFVDQKILLKDFYIKKYYKAAKAIRNNAFDFEDVENDEVVGFEISDEEDILVKAKKENSSKTTLNQYINTLFEDAKKDFYDRKFKDSFVKFEKLLEISGDDYITGNSYYYLGLIYKVRKKYILAEQYFDKALAYNNTYKLHFEKGIVCEKQEKYEEALKEFDICNKINFNCNDHRIEKTRIYYNIGEKEKAYKILDNCLLYSPNNYWLYYEKAKMLYEDKNYAEALNIISVCDQIHNNYDRHKLLKGKMLYLLDRKEEALELFDECVSIANQRNTLVPIIDIGYFFHNIGNKDLAYKYYKQTTMYNKWIDLSTEEIQYHFDKHNLEEKEKDMHSVLKENLRIEDLNELIKNIDKTSTTKLYDIYQIYWPKIGYMQIKDKENLEENYLNILTLPFTKKVMMCYPSDKEEKNILAEIKSIDEIRRLNKKQDNECLETNENDQLTYVDSEPNSIEEKTESKKYEFVDSESESLKGIKTKKDVSIDNNLIGIFEENKDRFIMLINMLENPTEQVLLFLSLGYVNKKYSIEELSEMFNMKKEEINEIINNALNNIMNLSLLTINGVEAARKSLFRK